MKLKKCLGYVEDANAAYNIMKIPKRNRSEAVKVQFSVYMQQIIELNERDQSLSIAMYHRFAWVDDFMTWNPAMNGDIKEIVVSADSVWTPDIVLTNSLSDGFDAKFRSLVTITHKGEALWLPPAILYSICEGQFHL